MPKFVVVVGSLMSGLGKGVVTASILKILQFYNYKVLPFKFDGYLNYDCGTMNPYRHGEVFVLNDKSEVDMDFGTYERFLGKDLTGASSLTGGKLFSEIVNDERKGMFLGQDVQIIPHLTDRIIEKVEKVAKENRLDVLVIEVGGTIGDIENSYFIEAMRQLALKEKVVFIEVTYIPILKAVGEQKTKPSQLAFKSLMQAGIIPNMVICRSETPINEQTKKKLALFMNLNEKSIFDDSDLPSVYEVPIHLMDQGFDKVLLSALGLGKEREISRNKLAEWKSAVEKLEKPKKQVSIAIVGKYTALKDAYASVKEALNHAGAFLNTRIDIKWVEAEDIEKSKPEDFLSNVKGVIVPGGFGNRGIEGKIQAIRYAREHGLPYLGLCLGMQLMAIEYARNVCGLKGANSTEFDKRAKYKIIDLLPSQLKVVYKGGTMRLGAWEARITNKNSIAYASYHSSKIFERHRHRYEFNNKYRKLLSSKGLKITATTPDKKLVEIIEWSNGLGIGTQAHPELKSKLLKPAPLFVSFVKAALSLK
ncbi:MAG: glutamine hydrolyzing CTP synthase [Candidatus Micrarchaeia archaeon]